MNTLQRETAHRILIIDDNPRIHRDFETILIEEEENPSLNTLRSEIFGKDIVNRASKNL